MHFRQCVVIPVFITMLAATVATPASADVRYQVTPLGPITPVGINAHGQVAGFTGADSVSRRGALWLPAPAYGLGAGLNDLGRPAFASTANGFSVSGVNDHGQVIGNVVEFRPPGEIVTGVTAALWLPSPAFGRPAGWSVMEETPDTIIANSINNSSQVAAGGERGGSVWLPAPAFGRPAGSSAVGGWTAADINEAGQVAGSTTSGGSAPFIHLPVAAFGRAAGAHPIAVSPTGGGSGPFDAFGNAINDRGQVVGSWTQFDIRTGRSTGGGFLWLPEADPVLGLPAGTTALPFGGYDINSAGLVLGGTSLWDPSTRSVLRLDDLVDPGAGLEILSVWDLNDAGQIAGRGRINGQEQGFLLTPVPEPASLPLAVLAGVAALCRRGMPARKRHNGSEWRCDTGSSSR